MSVFGLTYTCTECRHSFNGRESFEKHNEEYHDGEAGAMPG